jgi:8-oxo-dGTP pyrophosphatase MutT (NUDIX family)
VTPDGLAEALSAHDRIELPALPGRRNHLRAGVLLPLVWREGPVAVVTVRAATLRKHAGEVCFPGGKPDPGDADLFATATREAREELGITEATQLGRLSSIPLYTSDYRLEPFVARVPDAGWTPNPGEVAEVLEVSLADVLAWPHIDAIPWEHDGVEHLSPAFALGEHVMFGGTAHAFFELLQVAARSVGGQTPPLVPGRFQWSDLLDL